VLKVKRSRFLTGTVLCVAFGMLVLAQQDRLAEIDAYAAKAAKDWGVPGLSIAVIKNGKVVLSKGYGLRELGKNDPADEHTLFAIGSTTKAMTAAVIGMLVDDKKLAWDDPVIKHLPAFQLKDPVVTRELTVRDLLTHRGGLGNADFLWYGQNNSMADILDRVKLIDPAYSLRSRFIYQNVMYGVAGEVTEAVSGRPWKEMIRARIFEPLGMRETVATLSQIPKGANVASPHEEIDGTLKVIENMPVDAVGPAGSVWSSAHDMAKWLQFLLDGGVADGKKLLSERTFAELFRPQAIVHDPPYPSLSLVKPHWVTYGLGWFQQDYQGRAVDFHTGSIDGMVAIVALIRDEKLAMLVLGNRDHAEVRHALMYTTFDRAAGQATRDWSADLRKFYGEVQERSAANQKRIESLRVANTTPSLPLAGYAGTYSDPLRGTIEVTADGDTLRIKYGSGFSGTLEHWHFNTFRAKWNAAWRGRPLVAFTLGAAGGRVDALEMSGGRFLRRQ
jgi:CubicO group peptidase (beta-lactamase class C family)